MFLMKRTYYKDNLPHSLLDLHLYAGERSVNELLIKDEQKVRTEEEYACLMLLKWMGFRFVRKFYMYLFRRPTLYVCK